MATRVGGSTAHLFDGRGSKVPVHEQQDMGMAEKRVHRLVPSASACGIPASKPLSVLDRDRAYSYSDACTVYRVPTNDL